MSFHSKQSLYERLHDRKFRDAFVSSRIAQTIATQARVLRQRNEMSQKDLARSMGTSQNAIYRLENPKYGRPNISTLKKLAAFFKVGLIVRFAPLSEIADWTINLSEKSIDVPDFDHDTGFVDRKGPVSEGHLMVTIVKATGTDEARTLQPSGAGKVITFPLESVSHKQVATLEAILVTGELHG